MLVMLSTGRKIKSCAREEILHNKYLHVKSCAGACTQPAECVGGFLVRKRFYSSGTH